MNEPFVRNVGRPLWYDVLKQSIKSRSPQWFVGLVQRASRPYVRAHVRARRWLHIRRRLGLEEGTRFARMYEEALARWDRGERSASGAPVSFAIPGEPGAVVWLRPGTPDFILYYEIFIEEQYGRVPLENVRSIVDCGANIGLSAAYFLRRFPASRVIAVEPDPVNLELCRRNLAGFGNRVEIVDAAVWPEETRLSLDPAAIGTWASSVVRGERSSGASVRGVTIESLLREAGLDELDLLKIDIEGAELPLFQSENTEWMRRVRCIQVELESEAARVEFFRKATPLGFTFHQHRETLVASRADSAGPGTVS